MSKENPTPEEVEKWKEEWTKLVHEGACCASDEKDPHREQKKALIEDIKKDAGKSKKD